MVAARAGVEFGWELVQAARAYDYLRGGHECSRMQRMTDSEGLYTADYLRARADEARLRADEIRNADAKNAMLQLAEMYENMGRQAREREVRYRIRGDRVSFRARYS